MLVARYSTVSSASALTSHRTQFASVIKTLSTASVCNKRCFFNCLLGLPCNSLSYALYTYTHEPTEKVTMVGVLFSARRLPFVHLAIPAYETHRCTVTAEKLTLRRNLAFIHKGGHHPLATRTEIRSILCEVRPDS
jgi:hypothetical protein